MSCPDPQLSTATGNRIEQLIGQTNTEQSPQSSDEQSGQKAAAEAAKGQVQPAVVAEADRIDALSSPSSSKKTPQDEVVRPPSSPSFFENSAFFSLLETSVRSFRNFVARTLGCKGRSKGVLIAVVALLLYMQVFVVQVIHLVELHFFCLSILVCSFVSCSGAVRGKWAKQPAIQIAENKRNPYRDAPSLNEDDPMEPPCPRPQQESPKERVYQVDVHKPPTTLSSPSTSTAAQGVDARGASGGPSTSVVAAVNVHVADPQHTDIKEEGNEKEN